MRKNVYYYAVAAVLVTVLFASGCGTQTGPVVIGEKKEAVPEQDGGADRQSGDVTENGENSATISEMIQAPERYQASIKEEHMTLISDALVEVPDVTGISMKRTVLKPYTLEEYEAFKDFMGKKMGIEWQEPPAPPELISVEKATGSAREEGTLYDEMPEPEAVHVMNIGAIGSLPYAIRYTAMKTDEQGRVAGNYFTTYLGMWGGVSYATEVKADDFPEDFQEELKTGKQMGELEIIANELMEELKCGSLKLQMADWTLSYMGTQTDHTALWEPVVRFTYTKEVDKVPLLYGNAASVIKGDQNRGEVVQILLDRDGSIIHVYFCNRQETKTADNEGEFLLPFSEISQIFEQVMKSSYTDYNTLWESDENVDITFHVRAVKLGYKSVFEQKNGSVETEGTLLPVWNFYGTAEVYGTGGGSEVQSQKFYSPELTLLTVNAMDGTIVDN